MTEAELAALKARAEAHLEAERAGLTPEQRAHDKRVATVCWYCYEPACVCVREPSRRMKAEDIAWMVLLAVATLAFGAMLLLGGCNVYLPPCEPGTTRANPGGGVDVALSELADDGGEP